MVPSRRIGSSSLATIRVPSGLQATYLPTYFFSSASGICFLFLRNSCMFIVQLPSEQATLRQSYSGGRWARPPFSKVSTPRGGSRSNTVAASFLLRSVVTPPAQLVGAAL